jgi:hypothetical protein
MVPLAVTDTLPVLWPAHANSSERCTGYAPGVERWGPSAETLRTHGRKKSRPNRTRGQWGEPYGVTVHKKRGVLIVHSIIQQQRQQQQWQWQWRQQQ